MTNKSRAEISLEIFKEKLQETKLSIEKLGHIKEEEEKPSNLPMFKSTRSPKNVTVNQPTRSAKIRTNVTVPQEVEPKGLTRSRTSLERPEICKLKNSTNSKFSKTKILKKWNETKIVSGNKFEVLRNLKYDEPLRSTRKVKNSFQNFKSVKLTDCGISLI